MGKLLTPLELKIMNLLWKQKTAFVKELIEIWPDEEKPAYNTVSTTIRILADKEFVDYKAYGRTHQYFPKISKIEYQKLHLRNVVENVFAGSPLSLVSALMGDGKLSNTEKKELEDLLKEE